jgi:hypothetical protein
MNHTELIARLRDWRGDPDEVMSEAADAIEALQKENGSMAQLLGMLDAAIAQQPAQQAQPEREPQTSVQWLAEMIMSDCGCSTNNQSLLNRIINRIDQHERANTTQPERVGLTDEVMEAVGRGWSHPKNVAKVVDLDLAFAIHAEVMKAIKQGGAA